MGLVLRNTSAGSGKTTSIARDFIRLSLSEKDHQKDPLFFRRILGITFTNKAAEQLKSRVFSMLFSLSSGDDSIHRLVFGTTKGKHGRSKAAKDLLNKMIFHYEELSIQTIDSFYHQIVTELLREMMFSHIDNISLRKEEALREGVARLMSGSEDMPDGELVFSWLRAFIFWRLEEAGSWRVEQALEAMGLELFKEAYQASHGQGSMLIHAVKDFQRVLYKEMKAQEKAVRVYARRAQERMEQFGLVATEDFRGKSRALPRLFLKIEGGAPLKGISENLSKKNYKEINEWTRADDKNHDKIIPCVMGAGGLMALYEACLGALSRHYTAALVAKQIYQFGLMDVLARQLRRYRTARRTVFVEDLADILKRVDPEILPTERYESLGTFYSHYFIDEFQDTSLSQWKAIEPLIKNGVAQGKKSVLIGDGKQSIYSFRGAEPHRLLREVRREFSPFLQEESLPKNYRSGSAIVAFNGKMFRQLAKELPHELADVYENVEQEAAEGRQGQVMIEGRQVSETDDPNQLALLWLEERIEEMQASGYALGDMAVLVRKNKEIEKIVRHFSLKKNTGAATQRVSFTSQESLRFSASPALHFLVYAMQYLHNPDELSALYMRHEASFSLFKEQEAQRGGVKKDSYTHQSLRELQNRAPTNCQDLFAAFHVQEEFLRQLGLCDLVSHLIRLFCLEETHRTRQDERLFLQAFQCKALHFAERNGNHLGDFINWWEEEGKDVSLQLPESNHHAARLLTIHKAKGLEFKVALIPFCNWELSKSKGLLWCDTESLSFMEKDAREQIKKVPVPYARNLLHTELADSYDKKKVQEHFENLNALYVAFTRPQEVLCAFCTHQTRKSNLISDVLHNYLSGLEDFKADGMRYAYEEGQRPMQSSPTTQEDQVPHPYTPCQPSTFLKKAAPTPHTEEQEEGLLFHQLLSRITHLEDRNVALRSFCAQQYLPPATAGCFEKKLEALFSNREIRALFSSSHEVQNEVDILCSTGKVFRPDRVLIRGNTALVVDFKTGKGREGEEDQVRNYMKLLTQMGYEEVKGWLLYVESMVLSPVAAA